MRTKLSLRIVAALLASACSALSPQGDTDAAPVATPDPVIGWVLMDGSPEAVERNLDAAARYGVTMVQLSEDFVMNIDDLVGDDAETLARVDRLNSAIGLAHERGIEAYIWTHELSPTTLTLCYGPPDNTGVLGQACETADECGPTNMCLDHTCQNTWVNRATAYRNGLGRIPDVDGVVMMFGSAPTPPWYTACSCGWCDEHYADAEVPGSPSAAEKMRIVTEQIGGTIVNELGKKLVARTFVHEPEEIAWHTEAFSSVGDLPFLAMHKSDVQDWEPYNPPDPGVGTNGDHDGLLEFDVAGEYYGLSSLPFCAPDYFRYRLRQGVGKRVIGTATRVERGSASALGTPNEVNLVALSRWMQDPTEPVGATWAQFLDERYGLTPDAAAYETLRSVLEDTFEIRLKAHYVLGIWAMEKSSDIPDSLSLAMFTGRGDLPKWAPAWQGIWDSLDKPTLADVERVWQEGHEGVALASADRDRLAGVLGALGSEDAEDLQGRLERQWLASRAFRDVKLVLFGKRMRDQDRSAIDDATVAGWMAWALADLAEVADATDAVGAVRIVSADRVRTFVAHAAGVAPEGTIAVEPPPLAVSPLRTVAVADTSVTLAFDQAVAGVTRVEFGLDAPSMGDVEELGHRAVGAGAPVTLSGLEPNQRYLVQVRVTDAQGTAHLSGYHWVFTSGE